MAKGDGRGGSAWDGIDPVLLALLLLPGLVLRLWLAPYTTGSDIAQFAGFADTFLRHGLDFLEYSDGHAAGLEGWPYGWAYVYGPLFIVVLGLLRLAAPSPVTHYWVGDTYIVLVPRDWIIANKLVYIAFDTVSAVALALVVYALTRSGRWSVLSALLYYYNPMTIYISSIYGMFDQIPLAFLLLGLYAYLSRGSLRWATLLWALGAMFKPSILVAMVPFAFYLAGRMGRVRGLKWLLLLAGIILVGYAPFALKDPHGLLVYIEGVEDVGCPCYTGPVSYSFNGFSSVAFYVWNHTGVDTSYILSKWPYLFTPLYLAVLYLAYKKGLLVESMALGYIVFTAAYWRVNAQYLVVSVALLLLLSRLYRGRDPLLSYGSIIAWLLVGLWPLIYPVSFWAHVHLSAVNPHVASFLEAVSFNVYDDLVYVYYSLWLTIVELVLVIDYLVHGSRR